MRMTKKVRQFVYDLINDYGYKSYYDLSYSDKCEFVGHLIEAAGKQTEHEFLIESNHLDQTIGAFKRAMLGGSDTNFLDVMKNNAIEYYQNTMQDIFDGAFHDARRIA